MSPRTLPPPSSIAHSLGRRRYAHSTKARAAIVGPSPQPSLPPPSAPSRDSALSSLPLASVLRTYLVTRISSSPPLWALCFRVLGLMADPPSPLLDPEKNRALNWVLKKTVYAQFCAGENAQEVERTKKTAKAVGFHGVILEYALEVLLDGIEKQPVPGPDSAVTSREMEAWRAGMLQTLDMAGDGEFAALKWSGLGRYALHLLKHNQPPTPPMRSVIRQVCDAAAARNVALLPGAEEEVTNAGIDSWTLHLESRYNKRAPGEAIMYNTYQVYLRSTPAKLARHLADAHRGGYTLGVKLVRGAYLDSEPKSRVWPSKAETDGVYDSIAESLLRRRYGDVLRPVDGAGGESFPPVALVLATHNAASVQRAMRIRDEQAMRGQPRIKLAYAQLMGMADEVSCELVAAGRSAEAGLTQAEGEDGPLWRKVDVPRAYKCLCWGTAGQCLQFLLRRAAENRDAATRTESTRRAMAAELRKRASAALWLA